MLKRKRLTALLLTLCLVFTLMPTTAFAKAGDVLDELKGAELLEGTPRPAYQGPINKDEAITKQVGETGFFQRLPHLTTLCPRCNGLLRDECPDQYAVPTQGSYTVSGDKDVVGECKFSLRESQIAGYEGIPCLQFDYKAMNPGTATIKLKFYYNYNSAPEIGSCRFCDKRVYIPMNDKWYGETKTFKVTVPGNFTVTYTDGVEGAEIFADQVYKDLRSGDKTPAFQGDITREGYVFTGWTPAVQETVSANAVYIATWEEKPATVPEIKNVPIKFMDGTKVVAERYVTVTDQGEPVVLRAADLAVLLNNEDYELVDKEQPVTVKFDNAEVRVQVKSVKPAPVIKNVPIKFMDGTKVVAERYVTVTDQGDPVVLRAADLAVLLNNEDYELVDKEQPVTVKFDNAEVRVQVKKIPTPEDKTIIVNYVTEDGKNVLTSSIDVPQEATSVNTGLLKDAIYGYEIAVVGDIAIENGAINVTVRERVYTKTVTVNYVTENGENVLTSSIVVSKDATSVNTGLLKDAIYGYEIAVVGDIAIKDGAINVVVREKKQPEEPDNPPHHHGGGSSRSDKITITFMPADGYTLDAQKGTSLRKDGSVSMYISSGIVPEKMIPNAVRADKFYKVTGWAVKDRKGNLEEINLDTYRFKRNTEVYALYDDVWTPYKDMKADRSDWYYKELRDLSISGIVGGYRDGSYHAEAQVTWGAALKLIELAAGNPEQAQIPGTNHACSGYLALAKAKGHVAADAVIDLHRPITRLEFSQVAAKALDLKASHKASPFTDTDDAEVVALNEAGIINGYGNGQFGPKDVIKRSHIAAIIWRINQYQAK